MEELRQRRKIISQLVEARLEKGISQAELARMIGLGKDVSLLLNDKEEPSDI